MWGVVFEDVDALLGLLRDPGGDVDWKNAARLALVAEHSSLKIFDLADPNSPVLKASYGTPGSAYRVALDGDKALVADFFNGLEVYDVSNPRLPARSRLRGDAR